MAAKTTRLIAPNGTVVEVSAEKAERLISQGFAAPKGFRTADEGDDSKKSTTQRQTSRTEG